MNIQLFSGDLPATLPTGTCVAIDTETMGLIPGRDRLCLAQLSWGDSDVFLVQISPRSGDAPRLRALLENPRITKMFHFARFDMAVLYQRFGVMPAPVYCTKIVSRLVRTYTDRHGLKELCRELLKTELSKGEQSSDWGAEQLTEDQRKYAAKDVLYLHALRARLDVMLRREGRTELAQAAFQFLPTRVKLDLLGWQDDIFQH